MDIKAGPIGFPLLVRNYPNKCIQKKDRQVKKNTKIVNDNGTVTMNQPLRFYSILCIILDKTNNILCLLNDEEKFDLGTPQS